MAAEASLVRFLFLCVPHFAVAVVVVDVVGGAAASPVAVKGDAEDADASLGSSMNGGLCVLPSPIGFFEQAVTVTTTNAGARRRRIHVS
jgi:hypothetical protein